MFCARRRKKREPLPFAYDRKRKCSFPAVGKNVPLAKTLKRAVTADVVGLREALFENRLHRRDLRHGSGEIPTSLFGKRICVTGQSPTFVTALRGGLNFGFDASGGAQPLTEYVGLVLETRFLRWCCRGHFGLDVCQYPRQGNREPDKGLVQIV